MAEKNTRPSELIRALLKKKIASEGCSPDNTAAINRAISGPFGEISASGFNNSSFLLQNCFYRGTLGNQNSNTIDYMGGLIDLLVYTPVTAGASFEIDTCYADLDTDFPSIRPVLTNS